MWQNILAATTVAFGWLIAMTIVFMALNRTVLEKRLERLRRAGVPSAFFVFCIALAVRIVPTLILPVGAGYDIDSFRLVGEAFVAGEEIYTSAARWRHPYLPMQLYLVGASYWAALRLTIPFVIALKLPLIVIDALIAALIVRSAQQQPETADKGLLAGLLYAFNPVAIMVTAYHGQFDSVAVLLLLASWYTWRFHRRAARAALWLGFAVLNKTWPVVFFPIMFLRLQTWRQRIMATIITFAIPVGFVVLYLVLFSAEIRPTLNRAVTHTGNSGFWGASALFFLSSEASDLMQTAYDAMDQGRRWLLLGAGLFGLWATYKKPALTALVTIILLEFAVTSGIGVQWMIWVVPFAIVEGDYFWTKLFGLTAGFFLVVQNFGLHMYPWLETIFGNEMGMNVMRAGSLPAWFTVLAWLVVRLWQRRGDVVVPAPALPQHP